MRFRNVRCSNKMTNILYQILTWRSPTLTASKKTGVIHGSKRSQPPRFTPLMMPSSHPAFCRAQENDTRSKKEIADNDFIVADVMSVRFSAETWCFIQRQNVDKITILYQITNNILYDKSCFISHAASILKNKLHYSIKF